MDMIYAQAALTIVAAVGQDPSHGLPGVGDTGRRKQPTLTIGDRKFVYAPSARETIPGTAWDKRAWTFQESLFSKRKLVFTDYQVYFQCRRMDCHESLVTHNDSSVVSPKSLEAITSWIAPVFPRLTIQPSRSGYQERLDEYLGRTLSNEMDNHNAFRGILSDFGHRFNHPPIRSFCGLLLCVGQNPPNLVGDFSETSFVHSLTWRFSMYDSYKKKSIRRLQGLPSWSWIGWRAAVRTLNNDVIIDPSMAWNIRLHYDEGCTYVWTDEYEKALSRDEAGEYPIALEIEAYALSVVAASDGRIFSDKDDAYEEQVRFNSADMVRNWYLASELSSQPHRESDHIPFKLLVLGDMTKSHTTPMGIVLFRAHGWQYYQRVGDFNLYDGEACSNFRTICKKEHVKIA